jgi:hypothetical protein
LGLADHGLIFNKILPDGDFARITKADLCDWVSLQCMTLRFAPGRMNCFNSIKPIGRDVLWGAGKIILKTKNLYLSII